MPFYRTFPKRVPEKFPSAALVERMLRYQLPVEKLAHGVFPLRQFKDNLEYNRRGAYRTIEAVLGGVTYHTQEHEVTIGEQGFFTPEMTLQFERILALDPVSYLATDPNLLHDLYMETVEYHRKNKNRKYGRGVLEVLGKGMKMTRIIHELPARSRRRSVPIGRTG